MQVLNLDVPREAQMLIRNGDGETMALARRGRENGGPKHPPLDLPGQE
jgi:hypothetical protein